ncbi:hypothetical protein [Nonomuraea sp. NPDC049141]|uniref:hypothetical protein n=1 Tax=unclassified Nonomuraea TaxID=2593643 RepID=UPI0033CAA5F4
MSGYKYKIEHSADTTDPSGWTSLEDHTTALTTYFPAPERGERPSNGSSSSGGGIYELGVYGAPAAG